MVTFFEILPNSQFSIHLLFDAVETDTHTHTQTNTYTHTHILTYLLTPWSRVLIKKLNNSQLVKKFSAFFGTQRFILHSHTYSNVK